MGLSEVKAKLMSSVRLATQEASARHGFHQVSLSQQSFKISSDQCSFQGKPEFSWYRGGKGLSQHMLSHDQGHQDLVRWKPQKLHRHLFQGYTDVMKSLDGCGGVANAPP